MSELQEQVTVRLINQKIKFIGVSKANPDQPVTFDYKPPIVDGDGELFVEKCLGSVQVAAREALKPLSILWC